MKPTPGSDKAVAMGCLCPQIDNGHGHGYLGIRDVYVRVQNCPMHGYSESKQIFDHKIKPKRSKSKLP